VVRESVAAKVPATGCLERCFQLQQAAALEAAGPFASQESEAVDAAAVVEEAFAPDPTAVAASAHEHADFRVVQLFAAADSSWVAAAELGAVAEARLVALGWAEAAVVVLVVAAAVVEVVAVPLHLESHSYFADAQVMHGAQAQLVNLAATDLVGLLQLPEVESVG
jgi:hypothetical protein